MIIFCHTARKSAPANGGVYCEPDEDYEECEEEEEEYEEDEEEDEEQPKSKDNQDADKSSNISSNNKYGAPMLDVTKFPALLDRQYERYDRDNAIRRAIIHLGKQWKKQSTRGLLGTRKTSYLTVGDGQKKARNAAFDLLDALTKSGGLVIDQGCSFHVILAGVHQFDQSLMGTVIKKNVNPIVSVERSYLLMASTIQGVPVSQLLTEENGPQRARIEQEHAQLLAIKNE